MKKQPKKKSTLAKRRVMNNRRRDSLLRNVIIGNLAEAVLDRESLKKSLVESYYNQLIASNPSIKIELAKDYRKNIDVIADKILPKSGIRLTDMPNYCQVIQKELDAMIKVSNENVSVKIETPKILRYDVKRRCFTADIEGPQAGVRFNYDKTLGGITPPPGDKLNKNGKR